MMLVLRLLAPLLLMLLLLLLLRLLLLLLLLLVLLLLLTPLLLLVLLLLLLLLLLVLLLLLLLLLMLLLLLLLLISLSLLQVLLLKPTCWQRHHGVQSTVCSERLLPAEPLTTHGAEVRADSAVAGAVTSPVTPQTALTRVTLATPLQNRHTDLSLLTYRVAQSQLMGRGYRVVYYV